MRFSFENVSLQLQLLLLLLCCQLTSFQTFLLYMFILLASVCALSDAQNWTETIKSKINSQAEF